MGDRIENKGYASEVPPRQDFVIIYFSQKGHTESLALEFFSRFDDLGWRTTGGTPIKNWKAWANEWIWEYFDRGTF